MEWAGGVLSLLTRIQGIDIVSRSIIQQDDLRRCGNSHLLMVFKDDLVTWVSCR